MSIGGPSYSLRVRKLEGDHSDLAWRLQPVQPVPFRLNEPVTAPTHTVTELEQGAIYAFQLNYTLGGTKYFAARELFAWPSDRMPGLGERVATFPYYGHWPNGDIHYSICRDTFPPDKQRAWQGLIFHAFRQWEESSGDVIDMHPTVFDQPNRECVQL